MDNAPSIRACPVIQRGQGHWTKREIVILLRADMESAAERGRGHLVRSYNLAKKAFGFFNIRT